MDDVVAGQFRDTDSFSYAQIFLRSVGHFLRFGLKMVHTSEFANFGNPSEEPAATEHRLKPSWLGV